MPFSLRACLDQRFAAFSGLPRLTSLPWCISTVETLLQQECAPACKPHIKVQTPFFHYLNCKSKPELIYKNSLKNSFMKQKLTRSTVSFLISSKLMLLSPIFLSYSNYLISQKNKNKIKAEVGYRVELRLLQQQLTTNYLFNTYICYTFCYLFLLFLSFFPSNKKYWITTILYCLEFFWGFVGRELGVTMVQNIQIENVSFWV